MCKSYQCPLTTPLRSTLPHHQEALQALQALNQNPHIAAHNFMEPMSRTYQQSLEAMSSWELTCATSADHARLNAGLLARQQNAPPTKRCFPPIPVQTHCHFHLYRQTLHTYMWLHTHTHTHSHVDTHASMRTHTHTHTHTHTYIHTHAHARTHARTHAHTWKFLPLCTISMYLVEVACSAVFSEWVSESSLRRADLHRELQPVRAEVPTMLISSLCASTQEGKAFMLCHYNIKD